MSHWPEDYSVVPILVKFMELFMVPLAIKVNSNCGCGVTLNTLCPIILPFSTKNGSPMEVVLLLLLVLAYTLYESVSLTLVLVTPSVASTSACCSGDSNQPFVIIYGIRGNSPIFKGRHN